MIELLFYLVLFTVGCFAVGGGCLYLFLRFHLRSPESATRWLNSHPVLSSFAEIMQHQGTPLPALEIKPRADADSILLPTNLRLRESPGQLRITLKTGWGRRVIGAMLFLFPAGIAAQLSAKVGSAVTKFDSLDDLRAVPRAIGDEWFVLPFFVGLLYLSVWYLFGSITVSVRDGRLEVRKGPVWWLWLGNLTLRCQDVQQIFHTVVQGEESPPHYFVWALGRRGKTQLLGTPRREHALFVEAQLERHLEIADRPVEGEGSKTWVVIR